MKYDIFFNKKAKKFIQNQSKSQQIRIMNGISELPLRGDIKPLAGKKNVFRLRIGDYRIIYELNAYYNC